MNLILKTKYTLSTEFVLAQVRGNNHWRTSQVRLEILNDRTLDAMGKLWESGVVGIRGCGGQGGSPHEKSLPSFEGGPLTSIQMMQIVHYASKSILHFEVHDTFLLCT
jgi:hypothetical protein